MCVCLGVCISLFSYADKKSQFPAYVLLYILTSSWLAEVMTSLSLILNLVFVYA